MSPFIVTTKRPTGATLYNVVAVSGGRTAFAAQMEVVSSRDVATLEEARKVAEVECDERWLAAPEGNDFAWHAADAAYPWYADVARKLPESGGSVGPLPDGTVIEVAPREARR